MGHRHPANIARHENQSWQDRVPDLLTNAIGTMPFIYWATAVIALWILLNSVSWFPWHWDPYPYIFLNLAFSAFAFYSAPLILMSQNRQTEHDRIKAEDDYGVNAESLAWDRAIGTHFGISIELPKGSGKDGQSWAV